MSTDIDAYHEEQAAADRAIIDVLRKEIESGLPEAQAKVWHGAPVWFLNDNPTVGYSKLKGRVRLLFWSSADFEEGGPEPGTGKFKDAHIDFTSKEQIGTVDLARWLDKSQRIQWNYRDIVKHKGVLERL